MFFVVDQGRWSTYSTNAFISLINIVRMFAHKFATGSKKYIEHNTISPMRMMLESGIAKKLVTKNRFGNCPKQYIRIGSVRTWAEIVTAFSFQTLSTILFSEM